jgi:ParB-like chromosome segregation protein Spo0J
MEFDIRKLTDELNTLNDEAKIEAINNIKLALHEISPLKEEPVDCVLWIKNEKVIGNEYNPNKVAPPEMVLLGISIEEDGFTQPIVAFPENDIYKVVDGFHRNRVGKEIPAITQRLKGYLPVTLIRPDREGKSDRIASTIRHNRARGKHTITGMTDIIVELKRRNHSNEWIARELGMDADEILRLSQISGLAEMFADKEFSQAWTTDNLEEITECNNLDEEEIEDQIHS